MNSNIDNSLTFAGVELTWSPPHGYIADAWQGHERYEIRVIAGWAITSRSLMSPSLSRDDVLGFGSWGRLVDSDVHVIEFEVVPR